MNEDSSGAGKSGSNEGASQESRAENLGCGIGMLVAGVLLIANQLGWIKGVDWVLPAVIIGLAVNYLYKALSRK